MTHPITIADYPDIDPGRSAHIVLVEDDEIARYMFEAGLKRAGFEVSVAGDGRAGLDAILARRDSGRAVDLVITDMMMPAMSGIEMIDALKRHAVDLPILAITAYGDKEMVVSLLRRGCDDYVEKPVDLTDLIARVQALLQRRRGTNPPAETAARHQLASQADRLTRMRGEIDSAVDAYQRLAQVRTDLCGIDAALYNRPLSALGGDIFDIRTTPGGCDVLVADVSGHDMGASFHAVLIKVLFEAAPPAEGQAGLVEFMARLNRKLVDAVASERMVTALLLRLDLDRMTATVVCAGHPPPIRLPAADPPTTPAHPVGDVLGISESVSLPEERFSVSPGDRLFLFTDGLVNASRIDPHTGGKVALSRDRLAKLIDEHRALSLDEQVDAVGTAVVTYGGFVLQDDLLLAGLRIPTDATGE